MYIYIYYTIIYIYIYMYKKILFYICIFHFNHIFIFMYISCLIIYIYIHIYICIYIYYIIYIYIILYIYMYILYYIYVYTIYNHIYITYAGCYFLFSIFWAFTMNNNCSKAPRKWLLSRQERAKWSAWLSNGVVAAKAEGKAKAKGKAPRLRCEWTNVGISMGNSIYRHIISLSGWWFEPFFIFPYIGKNNSNWRTHFFQRGWNHQPVIIDGDLAMNYSLKFKEIVVNWWLARWCDFLPEGNHRKVGILGVLAPPKS